MAVIHHARHASTTSFNQLVTGAVLLMHVLLLSGVASAQTQDNSPASADTSLDIQTVLGFSNTFRLGHWTPLTVIVTNHDNNLAAELEVQVTHGDELEGTLFATTYRRHLELTRGARKRFRFTVLLDSFSRALVVRVKKAGRELSRQSVDLRRRFTEGHLIVVLSRDADLDYLNDSAGESLRVVYPHPELLPDKWQGYDGVSAVVLHGQSLEHLTARQYQAFRKWIMQGGKVVVSGGADYSLLRTPRLSSLLPAKPIGLISLPDGQVVSEAFGITLTADRPFSVNQISMLKGRAVFQADNVPLVVQTHRGQGRVSYFTFDIGAYPFDRWSGMTQLWLSILNLERPQRVGFAPAKSTGSPILEMVNGPDRGFPSHVTALAFLVVYLGFITFAYQRGNASAAKPFARWIPWVAPILFAPGGYLLFGHLLYPAGASVITVTVIEPFSRGVFARVNLDVGIYSNTREPIHWEFRGLEPVLLPLVRISDGSRVASDWSIHDAGDTAVMVDDQQPYVLHQLRGEDITTYDLHAAAKQTDNGFLLNTRNNTGLALAVAGLVFNNVVYAVPPIPAETGELRAVALERVLFALAESDWAKTLERMSDLSPHSRQTAGFAIDGKVSDYLEENRLGRGEALLVGVGSSPLVKSRGDRLVAHHDVVLVLVRVPVSVLSQRSRIRGRIDDPT